MRKYIKSRLAGDADCAEELDRLLELSGSGAVNITLPDISYLPKRKDAIILTAEDEALLRRRTIATLQLGEEAQAELREVHSIFGTLEYGYSAKNSYFTINDLGLSHYELRLLPEDGYKEIFKRLTCDSIDLKLIGETDGGMFCIKGFEPIPDDTIEQFYDDLL